MQPSNIQPKNGILSIKPYKPGLSSAKEQNKQPNSPQDSSPEIPVIKLSSNENALGTSPLVTEVLSKYLLQKNISRYPEGSSQMLRNQISQTYNIKAENIICGAGSDELLSLLAQAFIYEGTEAIYSKHGFLMYKISILQNSGTPIQVEETNYTTDLSNFLKAITPKTKVIFIANPNNPTGTSISKKQLEEFIKKVPANILIILDCAYAEFAETDSSYSSCLDLVQSHENLVITRTFSKIHGLAALRIGWCYCSDALQGIINRIRGPFNTSTAAQIAATTALQDKEFIQKSINHNQESIQYFSSTLTDIGIKFITPTANFITLLLNTPEQKDSLYNYLLQQQIITRDIESYSIPQGLRITFGTKQENQTLFKHIKEFITTQ